MTNVQDIELVDAPLTASALLGVPFDEQWEIVKPVVQQLYIVEKVRLFRLQGIMQERYGFVASYAILKSPDYEHQIVVRGANFSI